MKVTAGVAVNVLKALCAVTLVLIVLLAVTLCVLGPALLADVSRDDRWLILYAPHILAALNHMGRDL